MVVLAACGGGGGGDDVAPTVWPRVSIDVEVSSWITVAASLDSDPRACRPRRYLPPGTCDNIEDVVQCTPADAMAWIDHARLLAGDVELAREPFSPPTGASFPAELTAGRSGLAIELVTVDGQVATIPIPSPALPRPQPVVDGVDVGDATVAVRWHATPVAATVDVSVFFGVGGQRCHYAADAAEPALVSWPWTQRPEFYNVVAYGAATEVTTPLGLATVRAGASVFASIPP